MRMALTLSPERNWPGVRLVKARLWPFFGALLLAALFCQPVFGASWSVDTVSQSAITVRLTLAQSDCSTPPPDSLFVFSLTAHPRAGAYIQTSSGQARLLRSGYAGMHFRNWFGVRPRELNPAQPVTIFVTYDRPVYAPTSAQRISFRVNDCQIALTTQSLYKASSLIPAAIPFRKGVRIEIVAQGIYQISAAELTKIGVPVAQIPTRAFRLFEQNTEIPLYITNPHHRTLQPDDRLLFFGRPITTEQGRPTQFTESNMYWLNWESDRGGLRVADVSGARRYDPTLFREGEELELTARGFTDTLHIETDTDIRWLGDVFVTEDLDEAYDDQIIDNWYWGFLGSNEQTAYTFELPSPSADKELSARLRVGMVGLSSVEEINPDHEYTILLNGNSPSAQNTAQIARWDGQTAYEFVSDLFPVTQLKHGINTLTFQRLPGQIDRAALNWIRIEYPRTFRALDDQLAFANHPGDTGAYIEFALQGFTSQEIDLWDIVQNRRFNDFDLVKQISADKEINNTYTLYFQDSLSARTRYYAQTSAKRLAPVSMRLDTIFSDARFAQPVDYVIVTAAHLVKTFAPLAAHYAQQGLSATVISIDDLYNRFAGGVRDPEAIRSLMVWLWNRFPQHPPRMLLLGGDTSHDLDKNRKDLNIVPTHLTRVPGWGPCSDDGYFTTVNGDDNLPDLTVGRFPVRTEVEAQHMIERAIAQSRSLPTGYWRDNLLMIGGAESDFSEFNDRTINDVIGQRMNVLRMDAHAGSPFFKDASLAPRIIANHVNAGVYCINFNGHGGGNTWSDNNFFSYTDLAKLYNGRWGAAGKLPIVFSLTCLTGFFESVFYRSLGEEFVRAPSGGAAAFYGASAYTSKSGNFIMNRLLLDRALSQPPATVGELVWLTELEMLVRYGSQRLALIRQYNLLGDPGLPWSLVADTMDLTLNRSAFTAQQTLTVQAHCPPVATGQARIAIGDKFVSWHEQITTVSNARTTLDVGLKDPSRTADGRVRVFAWNDTAQVLGYVPFSKDMLLAADVTITPARPSYATRIQVRCQLDFPNPQEIQDALCLYSVGPPAEGIVSPASVFMRQSTQNGFWETIDSVEVPGGDSPNDILTIKFRIVAQGSSLESQEFVFPVRGLPDLAFVGNTIAPFWSSDSLHVTLTVHNAGSETAPHYPVVLRYAPQGDTIAHLRAPADLKPGALHHFTVALPDTFGSILLEATAAGGSIKELRTSNNVLNGSYSVSSASVRLPDDTLFSLGGGVAIWPSKTLTKAVKLFLFSAPCPDSAPLPTSSGWVPLTGDSCSAFLLHRRPSSTDTLSWRFTPSTGLEKSRATTQQILLYDSLLALWRYETPTSANGGAAYSITTPRNGPFALSHLSDNTAPQIRATVHGRELKFLDYAAKNKPFNLYFTDPSGVIPSSIRILLNNRELDSTLVSLPGVADGYAALPLTVYPKRERRIDSLAIEARDFAGNLGKRTFAYLPGEDLSIRFFACHPTPFAASRTSEGITRNPPRFAFLLTDIASEVNLTVYTMSGRIVRSWRSIDLIGYQEIEWDGLTRYGRPIANGTYFAKLTARNDRKQIQKIIKLAKLEGF